MTQIPGGAHGEETQGERGRGEVVISGVDTGPEGDERQNLTPTEDHARFQPVAHPALEPDNEDG
ncbi:hypothetical protein DAETH_03070 [Deinococcus aetherius]|uniref:MatE family transporter n=1 Tax=Deinococcus aetherius TaxID=200252 RepID=A0ABM8A9B6_9DEIO|nr:hypothetical protein [Deinococcus aetherius]BDP40338.1 hypothetical protein DAETH_03070 [Deinococcus aetherius]